MKKITKIILLILILIILAFIFKYFSQNNLSQKAEIKKEIKKDLIKNNGEKNINLILENFLKKNYSKEEMPKFSNYAIKEIDLDKNPIEKEYIVLAVSGMEECGSGGCNMYIVNRMGTALGKTTLVNTPVYIEKDKKFPALIVWSNGKYRKLIFDGEKYSSNASMAEEIKEAELKNSEKYNLIFSQ